MTIIPLLVNSATDALSHMFLANEVYLEKENEKSMETRLAFQREAMKDLKMLSYFSSLSVDKSILTMKQYKNIAETLTDAENLLGAWMNSDKRRIEKKQ